jgi:hypothetical protein
MSLQLRFLQTMAQISEGGNATFALMPLPMDLLESFKGLTDNMNTNGKSDDKGDDSLE